MEEFKEDLKELRRVTEKVQQISFMLKEMHKDTETEQVILNLLSYATLLQKKTVATGNEVWYQKQARQKNTRETEIQFPGFTCTTKS